jgi:FixJ family two-component response regulator
MPSAASRIGAYLNNRSCSGECLMDIETSVSATTEVTRIAVIDDDDHFRISLCEFIQSAGLRAIPFSTAEGFLTSQEQVDCIVCDFQIPGHMDGLQLLRTIRSSGQPTPVIVMSAFSDDCLKRRAKGDGAHCFLEKPITIDALMSCVQSATNARI